MVHGFADLEFFGHKDLALTHLARFYEEGEVHALLEEASVELERAERALGGAEEPYLEHVLELARAEHMLAAGQGEALEMLERCTRSFAAASLPDLEIPALVSLAEALADRGYKETAEHALTRAMSRARKDGYSRYLPSIREAMKSLELVESAVEERGRLDPYQGTDRGPDGYTNLKRIGIGGFGEVWRALDPRTNRVVAIKMLRLDELYDARKRRRLEASTRVEMEAASRIRHPGIARVLAIGTDSKDRTYVVQEFIEGKTLRRIIRTLDQPGFGCG